MKTIRFQSRHLIKRLGLSSAAILACFSLNNAFAMDKVKFQLDWLPGGDKAPVYVGIEKGFFKAEGIEVEVASGRGSSDAINKIATGNADMGLSDLVALLMSKQQKPSACICGIFGVQYSAPCFLCVGRFRYKHSI